MLYRLSLKEAPVVQRRITEAVRITARALAADRSTKLLPIIVAETLFIGSIAVALGKSASGAKKSASRDTIFVNVEAHSTAFSALYFWILPAVFLGALIGVSQTEAAIPRILKRFHVDLDRLLMSDQYALSDISLDGIRLALPHKVNILNKCLAKDQMRIYHGGVYSWQPSRWQPKDSTPPTTSRIESSGRGCRNGNRLTFQLLFMNWRTQDILPYLIVIIGSLTGVIISSLVPPGGFVDCRRITEVLICFSWIISALLDVLLIRLFPLKSDKATWLFWSTFIKDLLMTIATIGGGIIVTVIGVFNRCVCYTNWGKTGLALPQRPDLANLLNYRLEHDYPAILFTSIGVELLLIPIFICLRYRYALRVFIQRDDRTSNAVWLWKMHRKWKVLTRDFPQLNILYKFQRPLLHRSMTSGERGLKSESLELQRLTHTHPASAEEAHAPSHRAGPVVSLPEIPIHTNSWGMDPAIGSGTDDLAGREPRRRDTEPQQRDPNLI